MDPKDPQLPNKILAEQLTNKIVQDPEFRPMVAAERLKDDIRKQQAPKNKD